MKQIEYDDAKPGCVLIIPETRIVLGADKDGDAAINGEWLNDDDYAILKKVGATLWSNETEFECDSFVAKEGSLTIHHKPTLILTGIGQEVPTGRVMVTMRPA